MESKKDDFINQFNSIDLLQSISALSLHPKNHGKNIRFEQLSLRIIRNFNNKNKKIKGEVLKAYLSSQHSFNSQEDPPANPFTDLVTFFGGDYLIFPGITEDGGFVLSNLLTAIYNWTGKEIPDEFKNTCFNVSSLLLKISDEVIKRVKLERYEIGQNTKDSLIYIPNELEHEKLKSAIVFTEKDFKEIIRKNKIDGSAIEPFLIDIHSSEINNLGIEENPLIYKPILFSDGKYFIISPSTISLALTDFIWSHARRLVCLPAVNKSFHEMMWNSIQPNLSRMGFEWIEELNPIENLDIPLYGAFYKFDVDKAAYIQYIYDDGENYYRNRRPRSENKSFGLATKIYQHKEEKIGIARRFEKFKEFQFIDISILSPIGRDYDLPVKPLKNMNHVMMPLFDLEIIFNLHYANAIDIWKYSIALVEQLKGIQVISFTFLDLFKFFKDHDNSFYLSDTVKYGGINIQVGYSSGLVKEYHTKLDRHSEIYLDDKLVLVPVIKKDEYGSVYKPTLPRTRPLSYIDGFHQPMWVATTIEWNELSKENSSFYNDFMNAISYWLEEIRDDLMSRLKLLGDKPIEILFEFDKKEKFNKIERNVKRDETLSNAFRTEIKNHGFVISIPDKILPYLYGSDNEGERIMVKNLIYGFNKLLKINHIETFSEESTEKIIATQVPLGMKKMVFIIDTADNLLLEPQNLQEPRYIESYDENIILNSLVPELNQFCPPVGEIESQEDKANLIKNVVGRVLFPKLKQVIAQYDSEKLITKFILLNETLIKEREYNKVIIPSRVACFVSMQQQIDDLQNHYEKINRTSVSVRCLIEFIAAEQPRGKKVVSVTAIDELIAIMDQIISWGSLGDQVLYNLFDVKIGILRSGRIGTQKNFIDDVVEPYFQEKVKEDVSDSISLYDRIFPQVKPLETKEVPANLDKAFQKDFGITFTRLCEFLGGLALIGIEQNNTYCSLPASELHIQLNKKATPFEKNEFDSALDFVTLNIRSDYTVPPSGYDKYDIFPWRFNRRLSLLRKPLIVILNADGNSKSVFYWGFRQALATRQYLAEQIYTNRLKVDESSEMKKVLGKIANAPGKQLVEKIRKKLTEETNIIVDTEVPINNSTELYSEIDLGYPSDQHHIFSQS